MCSGRLFEYLLIVTRVCFGLLKVCFRGCFGVVMVACLGLNYL